MDNPSYTTRPAVLNPSADNYVNLPQHRMAAAAAAAAAAEANGSSGSNGGSPLCEIPDAFSNPSYVTGAALGMITGQHGYA